MKIDAVNDAPEAEQLRELEVGEPFEPGIRLASIALAGVSIFLSTGCLVSVARRLVCCCPLLKAVPGPFWWA